MLNHWWTIKWQLTLIFFLVYGYDIVNIYLPKWLQAEI